MAWYIAYRMRNKVGIHVQMLDAREDVRARRVQNAIEVHARTNVFDAPDDVSAAREAVRCLRWDNPDENKVYFVRQRVVNRR